MRQLVEFHPTRPGHWRGVIAHGCTWTLATVPGSRRPELLKPVVATLSAPPSDTQPTERVITTERYPTLIEALDAVDGVVTGRTCGYRVPLAWLAEVTQMCDSPELNAEHGLFVELGQERVA